MGSARETLEMRWVTAGELPLAVLRWFLDDNPCRPETCVDRCLVEQLRPDGAVKVRGASGVVESKTLAEAPLPLVFAPSQAGVVQRWRKQRVPAARRGPALPLAKRRCRRQGLEVVALELGGRPAWSVAVTDTDETAVDAYAATARERLLGFPLPGLLHASLSRSFPQWLLDSGAVAAPSSARRSGPPARTARRPPDRHERPRVVRLAERQRESSS